MSVVREHAVSLETEPAAVRDARRSVAAFLEGWNVDTVDRAVLCTSELVTNAIEHGAPPVVLRVEVADDGLVVEVHDGSERRPQIRRPSLTDVRGRGLLIVDSSADRWGVLEEPQGKAVWFAMAASANGS